MSRRQITPVEFAQLIQTAQANRATRGDGQIAACRNACLQLGIHDDWSAPLLAFLNDSPTTAEAWAERMYSEALDRAYLRCEGVSS
jgi:hypothetical protein